jgi:thioester reductase-like protein
VTGAGGFLAGDLLPRLLDAYPETAIYILLRTGDRASLAERRQKIVERYAINGTAAERVVAVAGDIEQEDLGLGKDYERLAAETVEIYHSAACTRFDQKLEEARRINLGGTEHVLAFAQRASQLGRFTRFHHVSTAYVAGNRTGSIKEDDLDCGQDFFNTYEQSKYESEMILGRARAELPITIYRPSIIVGDSRTGRTLHFFVMYEPMKWFYQGQLSFLPCQPELKLDIVPIDYVCDAMIEIGRRADSAGKTYHLSAGPERSVNLSELVEHCIREINRYNADMGKEPMAPPQIVTPDMIDQYEGEDRKQYGAFFKRAMDQMQRHMPYAVSEKIFDDTHTRAALEGSKINCPSFRDYVPAIVRYALERQFRTEE